MLPKEKPCENCIHRKVCEATKRFQEIEVKVTHPFFIVKVDCSQFEEKRIETKTKIRGGFVND